MAKMAIHIKTAEYVIALKRLKEAAEEWGGEKAKAFCEQYDSLCANGCEMTEVQMLNGQLVARPSADFMQLLASWGVEP